MLLTSKGAAGVAGGGFIALAATLSTVGTIPAAGIMLIFGIDKFMSECRALVNFIGNAVATLFVGRWDRPVDSDRVRRSWTASRCRICPTSSTPPTTRSRWRASSSKATTPTTSTTTSTRPRNRLTPWTGRSRSFTIGHDKIFFLLIVDKDELNDRPTGSLLVEIQPFLVIDDNDVMVLDTGLGFKC